MSVEYCTRFYCGVLKENRCCKVCNFNYCPNKCLNNRDKCGLVGNERIDRHELQIVGGLSK